VRGRSFHGAILNIDWKCVLLQGKDIYNYLWHLKTKNCAK